MGMVKLILTNFELFEYYKCEIVTTRIILTLCIGDLCVCERKIRCIYEPKIEPVEKDSKEMRDKIK